MISAIGYRVDDLGAIEPYAFGGNPLFDHQFSVPHEDPSKTPLHELRKDILRFAPQRLDRGKTSRRHDLVAGLIHLKAGVDLRQTAVLRIVRGGAC